MILFVIGYDFLCEASDQPQMLCISSSSCLKLFFFVLLKRGARNVFIRRKGRAAHSHLQAKVCHFERGKRCDAFRISIKRFLGSSPLLSQMSSLKQRSAFRHRGMPETQINFFIFFLRSIALLKIITGTVECHEFIVSIALLRSSFPPS